MFEVIEKKCPIRIRPKPREIELRGNFSLQFSPGASGRLPGSTEILYLCFSKNKDDRKIPEAVTHPQKILNSDRPWMANQLFDESAII